MDPALKFVVDIQNSEKVTQLTSHINLQKEAISALNNQLKLGAINQQQFNAAAMPMGASIAKATKEMQSLQAASGGAGRGLSQLSYAVDDIQYGFNAIVNNIPQFVMGLGGGMGLAGAVGIAAVAVNQLIKHWTELTASLQQNWSGAPAEQLVILADRAEKAAAGFEKLLQARTKWEKKAGEGFEEAIVEAGAGNFQHQVAEAMMQTGQMPGKRDIERDASPLAHWIKEKTQGHPIPINTSQQTKIQQDELAQQAIQAIQDVQLPGQAGKNAMLRMQSLAQRAPSAFSPQMRQAIEASDPAKLKAAHEQEEEDKVIKVAIEELKRQSEVKHKNMDAERKAEEDIRNKQKKDADKLHDAIADEIKTKRDLRIRALEDQRDAVNDRKHQISEHAWQSGHGARETEILSGAKAVVDMYQRSAGGNRAADLTKRTHALQEAANKELKQINESLKKERRLVVPK